MRKILLYLSQLSKTARKQNYECPDGEPIEGLQSNEAPVKYLLRKYNDISEIVCIVTKEARQTATDAIASAWDYFCKQINQTAPQVKITEIPYNEETSTEELLEDILNCFNEDDEMFLEITGGLRDTIIHLLLISRILTYSEIPIVAAVYSNFSKKKIEQLSQTIQLFDLVEGMQELKSFGSVNSIRSYYNRVEKKDKKIENMLNAVDDLAETISLCRTKKLDEKMDAFRLALGEAENSNDVLFRHMLAAFKKKFGREWNVLSVLKWCVESGMVQQALTIYTERIPTYIFAQELIKVDSWVKKPMKKEHEDENVVLFTRGFLKLAGKSTGLKKNSIAQDLREFLEQNRKKIILAAGNGNWSAEKICSNLEMKKGVERIIKILRYFCGEKKGIEDIRVEQFKQENPEFNNENFNQLIKTRSEEMEGMYNCIINAKNEALKWLFDVEDGKEKKENIVILTLENLEKVLPNSGYHISCSSEKIRQISEDYRYVKFLRNMVNHANEKGETEDGEFLDYLYQKRGYSKIETMGLQKIKEFILKSVERIEE